MRPRKQLEGLQAVFVRRLRHHRAVIEQTPIGLDGQNEAHVVRATIDCLNSWSEFVRAYYMSCCIRARTRGGVIVSASSSAVGSPSMALAEAIRITRPRVFRRGGPWTRYDEPTWRDPGTLRRVAQAVGLTNLDRIDVAFSVATNVFEHLPKFRNYFGHRNAETAAAIQRLAPVYYSTMRERPAAILRKPLPSRSTCVLSEFLMDLEGIARVLCE